MPITDTPDVNALPSSSRLLKSTLIALVTAIVILVAVVLPAEYGVDITGVGRILGLTEMGALKVELAKEAAAADAAEATAAASAASGNRSGAADAAARPVSAAAVTGDSQWTNVTVIPLAPNQGREVKLVMVKGAVAEFEWSVAGGRVNHDTHGDSTGRPNSYINYRKGTGVTGDSGQLTAAMDGAHGWFWRNRGSDLVTVTLRTRGTYTELKKMY